MSWLEGIIVASVFVALYGVGAVLDAADKASGGAVSQAISTACRSTRR